MTDERRVAARRRSVAGESGRSTLGGLNTISVGLLDEL